jgi:uncharacterized phage-like protein YoqJ
METPVTKGQILGITGHRPDKLGGYAPNPVHDLVKRGIRNKLLHHQPSILITGMALGTDQWAAEICIELRIPFAAFMPYRNFGDNWPDRSQAHLQWLLTKAHQVVYVSDTQGFSNMKLQMRNMWIVDNCNLLLAVYNGTPGGTKNCLGYAMRQHRPIEYIDCMAAAPVVQRSNIVEELLRRQREPQRQEPEADPQVVKPRVIRIIED